MKQLKILWICGLVFAFPTTSEAQTYVEPAAPLLDVNYVSGLISRRNRTEPETLGTYYIDEGWRKGKVLLDTKLLVDKYQIRYHLKDRVIEFQVKDKVKALPIGRVVQFSWIDENNIERRFVNGKALKDQEGIKLDGVFELLYDGATYKVMSEPTFSITEPTYNVQLDVGDKESKIVQKEVFYIGKEKAIQLITKNKNSNLSFFGDDADDIKKYMKANKLKFSRKEDLVQLITYIDGNTK